MSTAAYLRRNVLAGAGAVFVAPEGTALPLISGTPIPGSGGLLPFETGGTDSVQLLFLDSPTSGTFTITYNDNQGTAFVTAPIAYNATEAAVQAAIELLTPIGVGGVVVTSGTDHIITFSGVTTRGRVQSVMTIDDTDLTTSGTAALTMTIPGVTLWESAGMTEEGVMFGYQPTFEEKFVDMSNAPIEAFLTVEKLNVEYELAERGLNNLYNAINGATRTVTNQASGTAGQDSLSIGDGTTRIISLAVQGKSPQGHPRLVYCPSVKLTGPTEDKYSKNANNITVGYTVLADLSKPVGQRLFRYFDMTGPALA